MYMQRLILYNIYCKLHCAIFLFDTFLRPPEGENSGDRRGGERRARVRCFDSEGQEILTKQADIISKGSKKDVIRGISFTLYWQRAQEMHCNYY